MRKEYISAALETNQFVVERAELCAVNDFGHESSYDSIYGTFRIAGLELSLGNMNPGIDTYMPVMMRSRNKKLLCRLTVISSKKPYSKIMCPNYMQNYLLLFVFHSEFTLVFQRLFQSISKISCPPVIVSSLCYHMYPLLYI